MATGSQIKKDNFSSSTVSTYNSGETHTTPIYVYASAPSILVHCSCNSVLLRTATFDCYCRYYDWNDGSWKLSTTLRGSCSGRSADDKYFYHNWNGTESDEETKGFHLWEFEFNSTTPGSCTARIITEVRGVGGMSNQEYADYCYGKEIVSAGRLGLDWLHAVTSQDRTNALEYFRWSNNTGTQLLDSYANKMIPKSWV